MKKANLILCHLLKLLGSNAEETLIISYLRLRSCLRRSKPKLIKDKRQNNKGKKLTQHLLSNNLNILSLMLTLVLIVSLTLLFLPYYLPFIFFHIVNHVLLPYGFPYYLTHQRTTGGFDCG